MSSGPTSREQRRGGSPAKSVRGWIKVQEYRRGGGEGTQSFHSQIYSEQSGACHPLYAQSAAGRHKDLYNRGKKKKRVKKGEGEPSSGERGFESTAEGRGEGTQRFQSLLYIKQAGGSMSSALCTVCSGAAQRFV